jgi:hypothetical protein
MKHINQYSEKKKKKKKKKENSTTITCDITPRLMERPIGHRIPLGQCTMPRSRCVKKKNNTKDGHRKKGSGK